MIIVTGGAGFIGSNLVKTLNEQGRTDIVIVDDLTDGRKFRNLVDLKFEDFVDKEDFLQQLQHKHWDKQLEVIFHQGACSTTTEWDGKFMMANNYEYSKVLLHYCLDHQVPFLYASSAAVYGGNSVFQEVPAYEAPLNVYGYSKLLFDQYVRRHALQAASLVAGFRYFNVYGPREAHKDSMSSVAFHLNNQLKANGVIKLFAGCEGYSDGEQRRDFVYVDDVVAVNLWFWQQGRSGIYNVGTGQSQSFNEVAQAVLAWHQCGELQYIPFPDHLRGCYQSFTEANISNLRTAGYDAPFAAVAAGVASYLDWLNKP